VLLVQRANVGSHGGLPFWGLQISFEVKILSCENRVAGSRHDERYARPVDNALEVEQRLVDNGGIHGRQACLHLVVDLAKAFVVVLQRPHDLFRVDEVPSQQPDEHRGQRDGPLDLHHGMRCLTTDLSSTL